MRVLIAGCGYVGLALGRRLAADGHHVAGLRRLPDGRLPEAGIEPIRADLTREPDVARIPRDWDAVVYCAAPDDGTVDGYRATYLTAMRRIVDHLRATPPRVFLFTGSTSVYGQSDGGEVTEVSPAEPASPTARILKEAEDHLGSLDGWPAVRLRVAGIYGPGRNRIAAFARGEWRPAAEADRWMNLVHRDDLVEAIRVVIRHGPGEGIYNVADGSPVREGEFGAWLGEALALPTPGESVKPDRPRRSGASTNKRVRADRLRGLGWTPRFPSFREGYLELVEEWRNAGSPSRS